MQTCLIVDDSSVIRKVAARIIFQLGFTVENAACGEEALQLIEKNGLPDVAIVAASLGDNQGSDLIRQIRALPGGAEPVVLASLVEAGLGQMTRLKRAGATDFVYKPFNREALTGWLQPYLEAEAA